MRTTYLYLAKYVLFTIVVFAPAALRAQKVTNYTYPTKNHLQATLSVGIVSRDNLPVKIWQTNYRKEAPHAKSTNFGRSHKKKLWKLALYQQQGHAPLVYFIPGLGTNHEDEKTTYLAETFFKAGFHVLVLPNILHPDFYRYVSTTGTPGISELDAEDYFNAIQFIDKELSRKISIQSRHLYGFSLGALSGAFIRSIDHDDFFQRTVLVNPPVNLKYSVSALDSLLESQASYLQQGLSYAKVVRHVLLYKDESKNRNLNYYFNFFPQLFLQDFEIEFVLGQHFFKRLTNLLSVMQVNPTINSFSDYIREVAYPTWTRKFKKNKNWGVALEESGLSYILPQIASDPTVRILHNEDDFLLQPFDIERLEARLPKKLFIFSRGGHLGNMWHPRHQSISIDQLKITESFQ